MKSAFTHFASPHIVFAWILTYTFLSSLDADMATVVLLKFWKRLIRRPIENLLEIYCSQPIGSSMDMSPVSLHKAALLIVSLPPVEQHTASAVIKSLGRFSTPADAIARVIADRMEDIFRSNGGVVSSFEDARSDCHS